MNLNICTSPKIIVLSYQIWTVLKLGQTFVLQPFIQYLHTGILIRMNKFYYWKKYVSWFKKKPSTIIVTLSLICSVYEIYIGKLDLTYAQGLRSDPSFFFTLDCNVPCLSVWVFVLLLGLWQSHSTVCFKLKKTIPNTQVCKWVNT